MQNVELHKKTFVWAILLAAIGTIGASMTFENLTTGLKSSAGIFRFQAPGTAVSVTPQRIHAQYKMTFEYQASAAGTLTVNLVFKNGNNARYALAVEPDSVLRRTVWGLDGEFRLHDAFFDVQKIELNWAGAPNAALQIANFRIIPESELAGDAKFIVVPGNKRPTANNGKDAVRVYFELDNNDLEKEVRFRDRIAADICPYDGFRDRILEGTEELIRRVDSPADADVLVYSRALPGVHPQFADAVKRGARLLLYGWITDPEVRALSPLELIPEPRNRIPERVRLTLTPDAPMWLNEKLLDADYGKYYQVHLRSGVSMLKGNDGSCFAAGNGNIVHFVNGIGNALLKNGSFFDRAFLRAVLGDAPEKLLRLDAIDRERLRAKQSEAQRIRQAVFGSDASAADWIPGVSHGGFGRFGWAVEEGLQCASLLNDMTVENGSHYFRFDLAGNADRLELSEWQARKTAGTPKFESSGTDAADPLARWRGIGTVEWTAQMRIPDQWKGKPIVFVVEKGIDDIDETTFNGHLIGKTDASVPEYWSTARRYTIPEKWIRFGEANTVTVRQTNLRGQAAFGSRPYLLRENDLQQKLPELEVSDINWVSKEYRIRQQGEERKVRLSLLSPFTMFEFNRERVLLTLENRTAQYAAYPTAKGIKVVRLSGDFYRRSRDGAWSAPWLLLFRKNWENGRPLMLVFSRQPEQLSARMNNHYVSGIDISAARALGKIAVGWPWGVKPIYTGDWIKKLPPDVAAHLTRDILPMALKFPVGCDELFRIDRLRKTIEVVNQFRYAPMENDWHIPAPDWAALPPMAGFGVQQKLGCSTGETLRDFQVFATHGPILGRLGSRQIRYRMPLYDEPGFIPVDVATSPAFHDEMNRGAANGIRWSWGGGVRYDELTYAWPGSQRREPQARTINQSVWFYGLGCALQGLYGVTPENRAKILNRVSRRVIAPYEQAQYKLQGRYREEPFSGVRYAINFLSVRPLGTRFSPGTGSEIQYGDCNEACTHIAWTLQQLGDRLGYAPWIRANWNAIRDSMSFSWVINDYCHMAGSLNDQSVGAWVDMLNGEYAGMMALARVARMANDKETEAQALYRAARKALPTLLRFRMRQYWQEAWPAAETKPDRVCVGFGENRVYSLTFPLNPDYNYRMSNELFNFAQGMPGALVQLYWAYIAPEVTAYLQTYSLPTLLRNGKFAGSSTYVSLFSYFGNGQEPAEQWMKQVIRRDGKQRDADWPGMLNASEILPLLWRNNGQVAIVESSGIVLKSAVYHPDTRQLHLELTAAESPALRIASAATAVRIFINGKITAPEFDSRRIVRLTPERGQDNQIVIQY